MLMKGRLWFFSLWLVSLGPTMVAKEVDDAPINIGSRLELFVDDFLIDRMSGVDLRLHSPQPAGTVLTFDRPWEGNGSGYVTVFRDDDRYRLYYRASNTARAVTRSLLKGDERVLPDHPGFIAYAESSDGIHWTRPSLGLFEFQGSKDTNIIWMEPGNEAELASSEGGLAFAGLYVFKDDNPSVPASQRYKALATVKTEPRRLIALVSADALRWQELQGRKSLISEGRHRQPFDALTSVFWDSTENRYVLYFRDAASMPEGFFRADLAKAVQAAEASKQLRNNYGNRSFKYATSRDFIHWSYPQWVDFGDVPSEELYTPAVTAYFRAPHIYLAFPMRLLDTWRTFHQGASWPGVSDAVFMSSRDGVHWDRRFMEAFIRPGRDPRNWIDRSNMPAYGVVATSPDELSLYVVRNYHQPTNHLERMVLRTDGFVSVHAGYAGGEFVTKPLIFEGGNLVLNYSTSAAGSIRVEIQDGRGNPLPGFSLLESPLIYGDEIEHTVRWKRMHPDFSVYPKYEQGFRRSSERPLARLAGKTVHLRFVMKDADLYSIQFR